MVYSGEMISSHLRCCCIFFHETIAFPPFHTHQQHSVERLNKFFMFISEVVFFQFEVRPCLKNWNGGGKVFAESKEFIFNSWCFTRDFFHLCVENFWGLLWSCSITNIALARIAFLHLERHVPLDFIRFSSILTFWWLLQSPLYFQQGPSMAMEDQNLLNLSGFWGG